MTAEIVHIPFRDGEILAVEQGGKPHIVLRPAVESIGLNYSAQYKKLQRRSWATVSQVETVASDGKVREMATVDVRTFLMLLATIDENQVNDHVKDALIAYQSEVADAVEAYWTKGGVINPAATPAQLDTISEHAQRLRDLELRRVEAAVRFDEYRFELELINTATSTDPQYRDNSSRHVIARFRGVAPEIEPQNVLLMVETYLSGRGVGGADARSIRSTFGKALKKAYVEARGAEPGEVLAEINGRERPVKAYYERDRHLFDQVFDASYAHLAPAMLPGVAA